MQLIRWTQYRLVVHSSVNRTVELLCWITDSQMVCSFTVDLNSISVLDILSSIFVYSVYLACLMGSGKGSVLGLLAAEVNPCW